jgi:hypothetical protein
MSELYSFAIVLGSFRSLQALRESEKSKDDIGLSPFTLKVSLKTLWSAIGVWLS